MVTDEKGLHWCRIPASTVPRQEDIGRLGEAVDRAEDDPGCTALVLELAESTDEGSDASLGLWSKWEKAVIRLERLRVPTIALVAGRVHGMVFDLLLAADLRIVDPATTFAVHEIADGAAPGMLLYRITRCVGLGHAKRIVFGEAVVHVAEASRLGLVDVVTGSPVRAAVEAAGRASRAGNAWYLARRLMLESHARDVDDALGGFLAVQERLQREGTV